MSRRFFVERTIDGPRVELDGAEAHHLIHVLRAAQGDVVTLFDGQGGEFEATVEKLGRSAVELHVGERQAIERERLHALVLGVALPKGDRQKWLVEKAVEIGATALVPLTTERGVAQPTSGALDRLRRAVIEASKQCGRNRLMRIDEPQVLADYLASVAGEGRRWIAHPGGETLRAVTGNGEDAHLAIGPEGGFSDREIELARGSGWKVVALGPRILRVETAAIAMAVAATA
jgi:16S rRNA (uracil1498-N3)-methyltransferase